MNIIYPRIPHDEKKSIKLKYDDIEKVKHLYHVEKWTVTEIADKFNVSFNCIKYHLDPEWRKEQLEKVKHINSERYKTDEKFRQHIKKHGIEWHKDRKLNDKVFSDYITSLKRTHRFKNINLYKMKEKEYRMRPEVKERSKKSKAVYYQNNKNEIKKRSKEYNQTNKNKIKEHRTNNKDKRKLYDKEYYQNSKKHKRNIQYAIRWFDA